ncbi:MAG TPA: hypothetical protein DD435_04900 [Cyanobacteria bacterium UBA8530]|nr:hypothetical protein [Cyanobacteria bacterium UBA8530]
MATFPSERPQGRQNSNKKKGLGGEALAIAAALLACMGEKQHRENAWGRAGRLDALATELPSPGRKKHR